MLEIRLGDRAYSLEDENAADLVRRVQLGSPPLVEGEPEPGTTPYKLRDAYRAQAPASLDDGDLALVGVVLEAWFQETNGDLPADVDQLRSAIAQHLD